MLKFIGFILLSFALTGCYQRHSDDDLRTVPITNNPNIVPTHQSVPGAVY